MIIGSDLLYEDEHIEQLANFINEHSNPSSEVIIVDPGRGRKSKLSAKMVEFGYTSTHSKPVHTDYIEQVFKGFILTFKRVQ
jgi:predicted nicotinamide N-methyase